MAKNNDTEALLARISELEAKLAETAKPDPEPSDYNGEEYVEFMLPITGMDEQSMKPVFACVNGESIAIRPGEQVRLKRKFVDALTHARDQRLAAWRYMQAEQAKGRKALSEM